MALNYHADEAATTLNYNVQYHGKYAMILIYLADKSAKPNILINTPEREILIFISTREPVTTSNYLVCATALHSSVGLYIFAFQNYTGHCRNSVFKRGCQITALRSIYHYSLSHPIQYIRPYEGVNLTATHSPIATRLM